MRTLFFRADDLRKLLLRNKIATLDELKQALGTTVRSKYPRSARGSALYGSFNLVSSRGRRRYRPACLEGATLGNTLEHRGAVPHRRPADSFYGRCHLLCLLCRSFIAGDRCSQGVLAVQ